MKVSKLDEFFKGWVVGNFEPSLFKTDDFEVSVKNYKKGDYEQSHYHKIATELTIITKGRVVMNNEVYNEGDIITIEPGDITDFRATNDVSTTVIKFPCLTDDKYLVE
jgi:quercetin dioxygenase-like cupin family protein